APPTLGVVTDPRADALARRQGVEGALILRVLPGTAADRAGLRPARIDPGGRLHPGDVITRLDGRDIAATEELRAALDRHRAGDEIVLEVLRDGEPVTIEMTLDPGS